jgi:hypothetical protein
VKLGPADFVGLYDSCAGHGCLPALGIDDARRVFGYSARDAVKVKENGAEHAEEEQGDSYHCEYTRNGSTVLKLDVLVWHVSGSNYTAL